MAPNHYSITKEFAFEASHSLPQMPEGHKCKRLHGHSYRVIVELSGILDTRTGFIRDFGDLAVIKKYIDDKLDHQHLNDVLGGGEWTTAERLAAWLFMQFNKEIPELSAVTVCETAKTSATYRPPFNTILVRQSSFGDRLLASDSAMLEAAMGIISNVDNGGWSQQSVEWCGSAKKWIVDYHRSSKAAQRGK